MKTKRFYDPPRVETMNLHVEGVLCASGEDNFGSNEIVGFGSKDFSGLWVNEE